MHSGKSRQWLQGDNYGIPLADMAFGAIVGVVRLALCFCVQVRPGLLVPESALRAHPWLAGHQHVEGPYCWVLTEVFGFKEPIEYRGAQGLFDIQREVVSEELELIHMLTPKATERR